MRLACLSVHAGYRCQDSGACCTSGWPIPIETARHDRVDEALRAGRLRVDGAVPVLVRPADLAAGYAGVLGLAPDGACAFYQQTRRRCAIHSTLGHDALPVSCQHFPRVCLIDRGAVSVTLSHYCPTAAALLFRPGVPLAVVEVPDSFVPETVEGLDARDGLPPLLHPRMLADRESYRRWEALVVRLLAETGTPESRLAQVMAFTERVRRWEPGRGPLESAIDAAFADVQASRLDGRTSAEAGSLLGSAALREDALVRGTVPSDLRVAAPPDGARVLFARMVAPRWHRFAEPIRRYLAAHAFANWCAYQGRGFRTVVRSVVAAVCVLRVEAARHCGQAGRAMDEALLTEAFRSADLLLVHLASREELARRLGGVEDGGVEEMTGALTGGPGEPGATCVDAGSL